MKTTADQIRDLNAAGKTAEEIVEKLNVSKARIKKILNRKSRSEMKKTEVPYDPKPPVAKVEDKPAGKPAKKSSK